MHGIPGEVLTLIATRPPLKATTGRRSIESIIFHHANFGTSDIAQLGASGPLPDAGAADAGFQAICLNENRHRRRYFHDLFSNQLMSSYSSTGIRSP